MVSDMINKSCSNPLKLLFTIGLVLILPACSSSGDDLSQGVPANNSGTPPAVPVNVHVVAADDDSGEVQNTISWTLDPDATSYTVYWDNAPGVSNASSVVVPAAQGTRYVIHSDVDVVAGSTYYYRVQATNADGDSGLSAEVAGTPQRTITGNEINDVAWNGLDLLVAVGDSGVILASPNGTADVWTDASVPDVPVSLEGVTWENVNSQFLIVGAGDTVLTGDGTTWVQEDLSNLAGSRNLKDAAWLGDRYIVVGNNGAIITSNIDGSAWTLQDAGPALANTSLNAVAYNTARIVVVGTNGTIVTSVDGITWDVQATPGNNDLNDITWDGSQFVIVGSNDTILTSNDGMAWTSHAPGTSDINFVAVTQWDSGLPAIPVVAAVGSSGTFVVGPQNDPGLIVRTGTTRQLGGLTVVDSGPGAPYFVISGSDGSVLTARY
jgi:photosystem II stability/assembly factor-like uncharacterized protein